jgi:hypothetical protein
VAYPETRGVVAATVVARWPLGNVFATPGRHALQPLWKDRWAGTGALASRATTWPARDDGDAAATGTAAARRADAALTQGVRAPDARSARGARGARRLTGARGLTIHRRNRSGYAKISLHGSSAPEDR